MLVNIFAYVQALASTLDAEEIANLRDQFNAIDMDKNGTITLEEIRQVCLENIICILLVNCYIQTY